MKENPDESEEVERIIKQLSKKIENASNKLQKEQEKKEEFTKKLNELWKKPLYLLDLYLMLSNEAASGFLKKNQITKEQNDYSFKALIRLHAKACLIGQEILILMKNGYASGAFARWRSLHETAVTALFICKHGNEVAERYLDFHYIESFKMYEDYLKDNDLYKKHSDILGYVPYDTIEDMKRVAKKRKELCVKYGDRYGSLYGWAAKALDNKHCTFEAIEKDVELDYLRPYYNMANHFVHAGTKGNYFNLGLMGSDQGNIILVGQSDAGLVDPGSNMAVSLQYINRALFSLRPTVENIVFLKSMTFLFEEINSEFSIVHDLLEKNLNRKDTNNS